MAAHDPQRRRQAALTANRARWKGTTVDERRAATEKARASIPDWAKSSEFRSEISKIGAEVRKSRRRALAIFLRDVRMAVELNDLAAARSALETYDDAIGGLDGEAT